MDTLFTENTETDYIVSQYPRAKIPDWRMLADTRLRLLALQFRMAITVYNDKKQHKMTLQMWYSIQY